ncbi:MAG TPA: FtsX-like permease family protein, partial [Puia sp.]|nr:FtsX-like permease family protein [Puia sp.]
FRVFPHQWLAGDVQNPLHRPNEVVLTQSRAETWFPGLPLTAVIGRTVILSDSVQATVSGIVKDLDANSDFEYQTFLSLATIPFSSLKNNYNWNKWSATSSAYQLLVKLTAGEKPGNINQQLARLTAAHLTGKDDPHTVHRLQPLADIHTNTDFSGKVSKAALGSLAMLALFLILLGCINFINLAIAQGTQRAKEIGIRKTFGSSKKELIVQFLLEAFLLTTITSFVALTAISLGIRYFIPAEGHTQSPLQLPSLIGFFVCLIIALTFLSGLYPAFILSGYQPVRVLKNQPSAASSLSRSFSLRKTLIIAQFTIAQIFLIGVFVVNKQVHYAIEKDMGFRQNAIVNIHLPSSGPDAVVKRNLFRDQLKKFPSIGKFSLGNESPAINGQIANKVTYNKNDKEIQLSTDIRTGDAGYLDVYEIHVLAGRNLVTT